MSIVISTLTFNRVYKKGNEMSLHKMVVTIFERISFPFLGNKNIFI
jgi:hypothetical protein